jgi:hypothetical protein
MKGAECTSLQWLSAMHATVGTKIKHEFSVILGTILFDFTVNMCFVSQLTFKKKQLNNLNN